MRSRPIVLAALLSAGLVALPRALPAQAQRASFIGMAVGIGLKPAYGNSDSSGSMLSLGVGRFLLPRVALRLDGELQFYGYDPRTAVFNAPCPIGGCGPYTVVGKGPIRTASVLASVELYELRGAHGFYFVAGLGPELIASHPDRASAVRGVAQAGIGLSLGNLLLFEARYQTTFGARAEPRHVVLLSVSARYSGRSPDSPAQHSPVPPANPD